MTIKIDKARDGNGFIVMVNGWGTGTAYTTYEGAVRVANAISDEAINDSGVTTFQYADAIGLVTASED